MHCSPQLGRSRWGRVARGCEAVCVALWLLVTCSLLWATAGAALTFVASYEPRRYGAQVARCRSVWRHNGSWSHHHVRRDVPGFDALLCSYI
ncbi:hypothetical protein BS78_08G077200 [Paspalum vaginatum]|nr:hypothetical protein BS78_08G077200 [Paspalum vaginatum]